MKFYNILDLKLQELHVFTAVAEYQSITKSADFLSITPSQVSKTIKKLEDQWGIQLFYREKNTIRLTPAGKHAFAGLEKTIESVEQTLDEAISVQKVAPFIRVGCPTLSNPNELIVPIVKLFLKQYPHATVTIECADTLGALRKKLLGGAVDVIFTADYEVQDNLNVLEWRAFEVSPLYLVMNREHALAQKAEVDWEDVRYEQFVLLNPTSSENTARVTKMCELRGFTPRLAQYTPNIYSQLMAVHINPAFVCLLSRKNLLNDGLEYRKLADEDCYMGFAYRREAHKLVSDFAECAMRLAEK